MGKQRIFKNLQVGKCPIISIWIIPQVAKTPEVTDNFS